MNNEIVEIVDKHIEAVYTIYGINLKPYETILLYTQIEDLLKKEVEGVQYECGEKITGMRE